MKKIYLLALSALTGVAFAQQPPQKKFIQAAMQPAPSVKIVQETIPVSPVKTGNGTNNDQIGKVTTLNKTVTTTLVGKSLNDQQSNASIYNRLIVYPDGKKAVTWTTSNDIAPYVTRGSGYNSFNGSTWGTPTTSRIESERTGFPNFQASATDEYIIAHRVIASGQTNAGNSAGLMLSKKSKTGSTWTSTPILMEANTNTPTVLWNRFVISGDYLIVIASYTDSSSSSVSTQTGRVKKSGVFAPQVYSRYKISTDQWLVVNQTLPGYDSTRYFAGGGDNYSIDAKGNTVAILIGGNTDDLALWKSADNGGTWTKTVIRQFPYAAWHNTKLDSAIRTIDGSLNVILDANDKAHCFMGRLVVTWRATTNDLGVSLGTNSIDYWYEGRPDSIVSVAGAPDINKDDSLSTGVIDSRTRYGNAGVATMPSSAFGPDGTLYLIFSALNEEDADVSDGRFRDIFVTFSTNNGATWNSNMQNLTFNLGLNSEQMYGSLAKLVDDKIYLTYLESDAVGVFEANNNPGKAATAINPYRVYCMAVPTIDIKSGKVGVSEVRNNLFTVAQNFPNPFTYNTSIPVVFNKSVDVTVKIVDLVGKEIYSNEFMNVPSGASQLDIKLGHLPSGIYIYNIEAEGYKVARKMIVD
ncbi:MAG: T9SS type A sorting domain-containing protein [Bacteroidia bacterium]|nr:T9SS type A sorting domain-containing protein [Bacteroidia bacterium]